MRMHIVPKASPKPGKKVLVVDDNPHLRVLLSAILMQRGYIVRIAEDGFAALSQIRLDAPDLILSDLYMPRMSGFELLSVVRRRFPDLPVIAMSSAFSGEAVPTGVAADAFYEKATSIPALMHLVDQIGPLAAAEREARRLHPAPIWIGAHVSDKAEKVVIACPECLRTSDYALPPSAHSMAVIRSADCGHCASSIHYAMVQGVDPGQPAPPRGTRDDTTRAATGTDG